MLLFRSLQQPHFVCGKKWDNARISPSRSVKKTKKRKTALLYFKAVFKYNLYVSGIYERKNIIRYVVKNHCYNGHNATVCCFCPY